MLATISNKTRENCLAVAMMLGVSLFFMVGLPSLAQAACNTYYVSKAGNNANPGTISSPWKTLGKASSATLNPCDTVYVRGGVYSEFSVWFTRSGTATQPISVLAYPGEFPVVDGTGLNIPAGYAFFGVKGAYFILSGFEVRNGMVGVQFQGANGILSNMNIHNMQGTGIYFQGDYGLVENNTVSFTSLENASPTSSYRINGGWGTGISAARDVVNGITNQTILRGNTVYSVYGEGLSTFEADGTIIENNVVYDNWATNTYISDARNVIFRNNLVYATPNTAVGIRSSQPVLLTLADEQASKPRSANNIVINNMFLNGELCAFCWTLVSGSGLVGDLIANNTLVNGVVATPQSTSVTTQASRFENNIIYRNDGGPVAWTSTSYTGLLFSNNLWSATPPPAARGAGDIIANPQLAQTGDTVDQGQLTQSYFATLPNSPEIGKGLAVNGITSNFLVASEGTINIGAYTTAPPIRYLTSASIAQSP